MNIPILSRLTAFLALVCGCLLLAGCATHVSPALDAVLKNDINGLRKQLDSGVPPTYFENFKGAHYRGWSLLSASLIYGSDEMTDLLLQRGADLGRSAPLALSLAADTKKEGFPLTVAQKMLSKGFDPNQQFRDGSTPLHRTCKLLGVTELFLTKGARVDEIWAASGESKTPLGSCLSEIEDLQIQINTMQSANANAAYSETIKLVMKQRDQLVENSLILINHDANPNATMTKKGKTSPVLFSAYAYNQPLVGKELLDHGADILTTMEPEGTTLLDIVVAKKMGSSEVREVIAFAKAAAKKKTSTAKEADQLFFAWVNHVANDSLTALNRAAMNGDTGIIAALIEAGADYSITDRAGYTAQNLLDKKIAADEAARVAAQEAQLRREAQAESDAHQSAMNRQGLLAVVGAAAIGQATSGKNFTDEQRSGMVDAYVKDRLNAANGIESNNFGQAADEVKKQIDMASMAAASQAKAKQAELEAARRNAATNDRVARAETLRAEETMRAADARQQLPNRTGGVNSPQSNGGSANSDAGQWVEKIYVYTVNNKASAVAQTEREACEKARPKSTSMTRILSAGACTCTEYGNYYGKYIECIVPYSAEITTAINPEFGSTATAQGMSK